MVNKISSLCAVLGLLGASFAAAPMRAFERKLPRTTTSNSAIHQRAPQARSLLVPVDHFHNDSLYEPHSHEKFNLRYWFDDSYYEEGGPVIVMHAGTQGSGETLLDRLQEGTLHYLAMATRGIAVILEHRYYGGSLPTQDFSTESLRFMTVDQALADAAYFAQNVVYAGRENQDLTASNTAYLAYGSGYGGAVVAFLRKTYPDVFWGAISSSGFIEAIWDHWAYWEPIRRYADPQCIEYQQKVTDLVDNILIRQKDPGTTSKLKTAFGLPGITHDDDFAQLLSRGISSWERRHWLAEFDDPTFDLYCGNLTSSKLIYPAKKGLTSTVQDLIRKGGYESEVEKLTTPILNLIGWMAQDVVDSCVGSQDACFSKRDISYHEHDISQTWRPLAYLQCTQWGLSRTGSGYPDDILPLVSRTMNLEYFSIPCELAFNITTPPDVEAINKFGGFGISYPRLALIAGEQDPWRTANPHAYSFNSMAANRTDSTIEPFFLIEGAGHHWDEGILLPRHNSQISPPPSVTKAQSKELLLVGIWMMEWKRQKLVEQYDELSR